MSQFDVVQFSSPILKGNLHDLCWVSCTGFQFRDNVITFSCVVLKERASELRFPSSDFSTAFLICSSLRITYSHLLSTTSFTLLISSCKPRSDLNSIPCTTLFIQLHPLTINFAFFFQKHHNYYQIKAIIDLWQVSSRRVTSSWTKLGR